MKVLSVFSTSALLFSFLLFACNNRQPNEGTDDAIKNEEYSNATEKDNLNPIAPRYSIELDPDNTYDPQRFSYEFYNGTADDNKADRNAAKDGKKVNVSAKTYSKAEIDRAPVFTDACMTAEDREDCTNEAVKDYIWENIQFPDSARAKNQEGLVFVTFVVDETGQVEGDYKITSKQQPCDGCAEAAVNAVASMPRWEPATRNGEPVKVKMTLPVRFAYRN